MHRRPTSLDDATDLARSVFLALQGEADGNGNGRTTYAIRLVRAYLRITDSGVRLKLLKLAECIADQ